MHSYKAFLYFALAGMGLMAAPYAQAQKLSPDDQKFVEEAAKGGIMEVHMGQLGAEHGNSPAVKTFAQRIITDHTKANDELKAMAHKKGVTLPPDDAQMAMTMPVATKRAVISIKSTPRRWLRIIRKISLCSRKRLAPEATLN